MSFSHFIFPCVSTPSSSIDFRVVKSGTVSEISILFKSLSLLFVTAIVYVISSPANTRFSPVLVFAVLTTSMSGSSALILLDASTTFNDNGCHPTRKFSATITSSVSVLVIVDSCIVSVVVVAPDVVPVPVVAPVVPVAPAVVPSLFSVVPVVVPSVVCGSSLLCVSMFSS